MANCNWLVSNDGGKNVISVAHAQLAVLMDIRALLQTIRDDQKDVAHVLRNIRGDVGPILHDTRAAAKRIDKRLARGRKLR
jgi:hypothetical protein